MNSFKNKFDEWIAKRNGKRFLNNDCAYEMYLDYSECFRIGLLSTYEFHNSCSFSYDLYFYDRLSDDFRFLRTFSDKEKAFTAYETLIESDK